MGKDPEGPLSRPGVLIPQALCTVRSLAGTGGMTGKAMRLSPPRSSGRRVGPAYPSPLRCVLGSWRQQALNLRPTGVVQGCGQSSGPSCRDPSTGKSRPRRARGSIDTSHFTGADTRALSDPLVW